MEIKLFLEEHVQAVFEYEMGALPTDLNEIQREMKSWENPWRVESLRHYSQLGWSFIAQDEEGLKGYVLGQPVLFFNNWTQTLWIEHMGFKDTDIGFQLMDTAVRWAKTKHLQKVIFNSDSDKASFLQESFPKFQTKGYLHLSTTKLAED